MRIWIVVGLLEARFRLWTTDPKLSPDSQLTRIWIIKPYARVVGS
jgi:hypothetical protein